MSDKNPYEAGSPHWQLFESMISQRRLEQAFIADVERVQQKAQQARESGDAFRAALDILNRNGGDIKNA